MDLGDDRFWPRPCENSPPEFINGAVTRLKTTLFGRTRRLRALSGSDA
jgi:hypothetical protein